ncbi:F-box protein SKIP16 [Camellia lanceoleosa]|uniref:F-box protein SKIP16 n=1 Tax=Camellia lanceoleosa TaxID=1840588 RepID=A0ACC0IT25_9ERIC|nr:F-box protein SKIP16 [Camellia lanceoleosa]
MGQYALHHTPVATHWKLWKEAILDNLVVGKSSDYSEENYLFDHSRLFPLLLPGEKEFVYESCTPLSSSSGSIEGSFTFVSGRLD